MRRVALLDDRDVFIGMDTIADDSQLTDRHLPQISECDLAPGAYRYDFIRQTFVPMVRNSAGRPLDVPSVEEVLYELLVAAPRILKFNLPPRLAKWVAWYAERTGR
jgi:hypothetical protein